MPSKEIEDRVMSERRPQPMPPTPGNPMFVIDVGGDFAVGTVFTSKERAVRVAEQLGIGSYSIREEVA